MCDKICVICVKPAEGYNLLGAFETEHFMPKQSLGIFIVVISKGNLTIIQFKLEQGAVNIAVCSSVIGTQTKVPRSMQAAQR